MDIFKSEFIASSPNIKNCPNEFIPEYAFIGRSNVGKSSLVNSICRKRNIAKVSGKPGKTKLINHFKINDSCYLTDLPGYGYANVSKTVIGTSINLRATTVNTLFGSRTKLQTTLQIIGRDSGARVTIPITINKVNN